MSEFTIIGAILAGLLSGIWYWCGCINDQLEKLNKNYERVEQDTTE